MPVDLGHPLHLIRTLALLMTIYDIEYITLPHRIYVTSAGHLHTQHLGLIAPSGEMGKGTELRT